MVMRKHLLFIITVLFLACVTAPVMGAMEVSASHFEPLTFKKGEQFLPVTIDPADGTAVIDGNSQEEALRDVYALSARENKELTGGSKTENKKAMLDFLLQKPCVVHEQKDGTLRAAYPFAIKILFVLAEEGQLEDTYGAKNAVYEKEKGRYILQYESQEDAAKAYVRLSEKLGKEHVLIDLPVSHTDNRYDEAKGDQTYMNTTAARSLSWGTDVMYLDEMRDWADKNPVQGNLTVAVIDSGIRVDETREEIIDGFGIDAGRILKSKCTAIRSSYYDYTALHDFSSSEWSPKKCAYADLNGHGTHVLSTILDGTPAEVKAFSIRDTCYRPNLYDDTVYSTGDIDGMVKSIAKAGELGARVVNMSQGIDCHDYDAGKYIGYYGEGISRLDEITSDTIDYYSREISRLVGQYDLCVVTAAGNEGKDMEEVSHFPAVSSGVVVVSSLRYGDGFTLTSSSNYGENISFCAPGANIVGAGYDWDNHTACYTTKSGTSMAAPHITAALATIRLYYPELDQAGAVEFLKQFCTDLGDPGWDRMYGYGFPRFPTKTDVTYVYGDSAKDRTQVTLPLGMRLSRPSDPKRSGYTFGGWYKDKDCKNKYDFSKPVMAAASLYAKWTRVYKHVIYNYNGHGGTKLDQSVAQGETAKAPPKPVAKGWKFCGWYSDSKLKKKYDFSKPVEKSLNLYAKWADKRKANPLKIKGKTTKIKIGKLKKGPQSLAPGRMITFVKKGKGKLKYKLSSAKKGKRSFKKFFSINGSTGKVTVKKGLKKGTYKVKIKVRAAGSDAYKASSWKTAAVRIKVK